MTGSPATSTAKHGVETHGAASLRPRVERRELALHDAAALAAAAVRAAAANATLTAAPGVVTAARRIIGSALGSGISLVRAP